MPDEQPRLEREIEEILGKIEEFPSASERRARQRRKAVNRVGGNASAWQQRLLGSISGIDMSQVMLLSFLLILGSFFFRRFSPGLTEWVLYAGIALFIASFVMIIAGRRGGARGQQYWRGRPVEYRQPSMGDLARRWFGARGRRR